MVEYEDEVTIDNYDSDRSWLNLIAVVAAIGCGIASFIKKKQRN